MTRQVLQLTSAGVTLGYSLAAIFTLCEWMIRQ